MSAEDWHGICFANGMSGNCNMDCEQFTDGDCDSADEMILDDIVNADLDLIESVVNIYHDDIIDIVKSKGLYFNYQILKQQTKVEMSEAEILVAVFRGRE